MRKLTHIDARGAARMVDVSAKAVTVRQAVAEAAVRMSREAFSAIIAGAAKKGDVLAAARIAGIMAAKKTAELIPLCHPIPLSGAEIAFKPERGRNVIRIRASARTSAQTGVEMEALTAATVAALTIYDMIKAVDRGGEIQSVRLLSKTGGKSGTYKAKRRR